MPVLSAEIFLENIMGSRIRGNVMGFGVRKSRCAQRTWLFRTDRLHETSTDKCRVV